MALILCIECKKEFSDKAICCPNCGCPTDDVIKQINNEKHLAKYRDEINNLRNTYICSNCGNETFDTEIFAGILMTVCTKCGHHAKMIIVDENALSDWKQKQYYKNIPHCPYCNSTNVKKISGTSRAISALAFGFASKKIGKQWHCNKCGSDF